MSEMLSIFSVADVIERIGRLRLTGALHVFRESYAGNLYLNNGRIVAADFTNKEGREALDALWECVDFQMVWQPQRISHVQTLDVLVESYQLERSVTTDHKVASVKDAHLKTSPIRVNTTAPAEDEKPRAKSPFYLISVAENKPVFLEKDGVIVGRDPSSDIFIDDVSVSRRHCAIHFNNRGLHVMDLHSTNGVQVNQKDMRGEGIVSPGDILTVGAVGFRVLRQPQKNGTVKS